MNYKRPMYKRNSGCKGNTQSRYVKPTHEIVDTPRVQISLCHNEPQGKPSLAMVYGVTQSWRDISDGCDGLKRGTIFGELNKPFMGDKCKKGGCNK